jgi:hypothetical protein
LLWITGAGNEEKVRQIFEKMAMWRAMLHGPFLGKAPSGFSPRIFESLRAVS